jgi:D-alanyl-lipoteichoic acid acyltransferase DltB (MBOAT superfamily)
MLLVIAQFAGILLLVRAFELENRSLFAVLALAFGGFLVHSWLPARHRLWFFSALSVASVLLVLGFVGGGMVLALGGLLIGLCHLPVRFGIRVGLILAAGAALLVARGVSLPPALPAIAWPVLGSMFMFRLVLYLFSIRHRDAAVGFRESLAYFFMLPNVCFPLFPVVDYKTFIKNQFDGERFRIYDTGIRWMFRGVVQLLLYRLVYYDLTLGGLYVNDLGDVVRHIVTTFLLYVKISGQFHLIVGLLYLFGFRLPETNHLYFLSSSITDFWRRINIYWKDFMMKVVYYPTFFRVRRLGNTFGIVVSTLMVFFATWVLHAYQFYWITGSRRLLAARDTAFWGIFAVLVLGSTLWELRPGRKKARTAPGWSLSRGVGTVVTFSAIAVLWSLWNAETAHNWLFMWTRVRYSQPSDWLLLGALVGGGLLVAGFPWGAPTLAAPSSAAEPIGIVVRRSGSRMLAMACLLLVELPAVRAALPPRLADDSRHLQGQGLALLDAALELQGYYEALTPREGLAWSRPWRLPRQFDNYTKTAIYQPRNDFLLDQFKPSTTVVFQGLPFGTNRWGMRDQDYQLAKPPGTYRIALLGASDVAGWGVREGEPFESVAEAGLDSMARREGRRVEILNFAIPAVSLAQQVYAIQAEVGRFSPDLILLTAYPDNDIWLLQRHIHRLKEAGIPIPDPQLDSIVRRALGNGLGGDLRDLRPFEEAIDTRLFRWATELAGRSGSRVALAVLRSPGKSSPGNYATTRRAALATGMPWLDCTDVWRDRDAIQYRVHPDDAHPNPAGHRVIAACLTDQLLRHAAELDLPVRTAGGAAVSAAAPAPAPASQEATQ